MYVLSGFSSFLCSVSLVPPELLGHADWKHTKREGVIKR